MNTDNHVYFSAKDILPLLKQQIDYLENQIAEKCGMKLYKSVDGFTQEKIYEYAGAKDCVATLTLSQESAEVYGELLTVAFVYYQKERIAIEKDKTALNDISNVKAKELLGELDSSLHAQLLKDGVPTKDIVEMIVGPDTEDQNTYASSHLRKPKVLEIPIESKGNGDDIRFMYGALCHFISDGIELTPEEHNEYLAYKIGRKIASGDQEYTAEELAFIKRIQGNEARSRSSPIFIHTLEEGDQGVASHFKINNVRRNRLTLNEVLRLNFIYYLLLFDGDLYNLGSILKSNPNFIIVCLYNINRIR